MNQQAVQCRRQQRQQQFLSAAAVGKSPAGGDGRRRDRRPGRVQGLAQKPFRRTQAKREKRRKCPDLHRKNAGKTGGIQQRTDTVDKIEQRALVVEDIPVEHLALHHGLAHGKKDVGVHPVVEAVER